MRNKRRMAGTGKQNARVVQSDDVGASEVHSAAVDAHLRAKGADGGGAAPSSEEITSLNKLLQWSAAHSDKPSMAGTQAPGTLDREWLDAMFPDMNAAIKKVISALSDELEKGGTATDIAELLEVLEEYLADLNYAQNICPLGVVPVLLRAMEHSDAAVRAAGLWATGSALQDMEANCVALAKAGALQHIATGLRDADAGVRLKAIRASSAYFRAADAAHRQRLRDVGAGGGLVAAMGDADARVRSRACFFAAHAAARGNSWLLEELLTPSEGAVLVRAVQGCDAHDVGAVESVLGAVDALVEHDRTKLLAVAPTLRNELEALEQRATNTELSALAHKCGERLK